MNNEKELTIKYYNDNACRFNNDTVDADLTQVQDMFLDYLQKEAYILDFGCGSGRDTKYFLSQGFQVDAIDGSVEMCRIASEYTGITVKHMYFHELNEVNKYDGVWACASILHLPYEEMKIVLCQVYAALKENGILYTSFKYGEYEGIRNGRYFTDMNEQKLHKILQEIKVFEVLELWITSDVRPGREDEKWLNMILRKNMM